MSINDPSTLLAGSQSIDTSSPPRPRKRPLRTYGRRSASDREQRGQELTPKKRKAPEPDQGTVSITTPEESLPKLPSPITEPPKPPVKRGSILSYFKPRLTATPSSNPPSSADICATADPTVERPLSPPPSSSPPRKARNRRRLTTKHSLPVVEDRSDEESCITVKGEDAPLNEIPLNTPYQKPSKADKQEPKHEAHKKTKRAEKRPKEMVQTVLSLSINKEPGFLICKECGILYNPLNGEDRKEHRRRHSAWVKGKGKGTEVGIEA